MRGPLQRTVGWLDPTLNVETDMVTDDDLKRMHAEATAAAVRYGAALHEYLSSRGWCVVTQPYLAWKRVRRDGAEILAQSADSALQLQREIDAGAA